MTERHLGLVVEGPGDVAAVPLLIGQMASARNLSLPRLGRPVSCSGRGRATREAGLEGFVAAAAARPGCRAVLVVLDGEGDPVCELGPELLARAETATSLPVRIILADPLYEAWLVASAESLGLAGLTYNAAKADPVAAIKRALGSKKYVKPVWQPRLTERIDPKRVARRSHSFSRASKRLESLIKEFG